MVYLLIAGRAGNQFFQYAMARSIQEKYKTSLALDLSILNSVGDISYEDTLLYFNTVDYCYASIKEKFPIRWKIIRLAERIRPKHSGYICYIYDIAISFLLNIISICYYKNDYKSKHFYRGLLKDYIVFGWFESIDYFGEIDNMIKKELSLKPQYDSGKNRQLKSKLMNRQSICISIRRGNFVSDPKIKNKFYICDINYYLKAVELIANQLENPIIYVCSDDIQWCKDNVLFKYDTIYEEKGLKVYEKIDIMKVCYHFVISNSTFSWWAQHLGNYYSKKVVAPKIWRNDKLSPRNVFEDNWIYLELT